jgi:hypothetical protein
MRPVGDDHADTDRNHQQDNECERDKKATHEMDWTVSSPLIR